MNDWTVSSHVTATASPTDVSTVAPTRTAESFCGILHPAFKGFGPIMSHPLKKPLNHAHQKG